MKLIFHLVRADVRRFRLVLAAWVVIEVLSTVFTGVQPVLDPEPRMMTAIGLLAMVMFLTRWLGMIVIVVLVVQTHPLVGSDAFWMTRPIPPRALFASKVLLLGTTFIAVPALCAVVLMAAFRAPPAEIVLVALQTMLFQSLWVALVMALASLTRDLARFILVTGGVLVSLVVLMSIGISVAMRSINETPQLHEVTGRLVSGPAEDVAMLLFVIAAAVLPVVIQYRTRSTRFSAGAGIAAVALAVLIGMKWPWRGEPLPVPAWASRESALTLVAESSTGEFRPHDRWPSSNRTQFWQFGNVQLGVREVEPGWIADARLASSTAQFADGATLTTAGNGYSSSVPFESVDDFPNRVVMRQVLGVGRVSGMSQGPWITEGVPAILVSQADFEKYSSASGIYRGRFLLDLDQVEIVAALPLQPGAEYLDRRRHITIDRVIPQPQAASIRVRQTSVSTMFHSKALPELSFYLRNRDAAVAIAGSAGGMMMGSMGVSLPMLFGMSYGESGTNGFSATGDYLRFSGYHPQEDAVEITADWLSRAELVIVRTVQAGSVTRTVEIPGFEMRAAPPRRPELRFR
jgi:hypothetical protein